MVRITRRVCLAVIAMSSAGTAFAQSEDLVAAAKKEGAVSIYSATDQSQAQALLDAFAAKYPGIRVDYNDIGTNGVYNRVISEAAAKQVGGDVFWTSAMDQGMKLAADGYLASYQSPETPALPAWAVYDKTVYATSLEPIGFIYNKLALPEAQVPKTRAALLELFGKKEFSDKLATFDPEKSGVGFMIQTNDSNQREDYWPLIAAFGAAKGKTYSSTGAMRETVVSGENVIAFNLIGSYALDWVKTSPNLGVGFGQDYTAAFSRVAGLIKGAPHPNAAKLFLDFLLSKDGQNAILQAVVSGELYIGYNLIGSYAYAMSKANPDLKVVVPRDYAIVFSRGALIPKTAPRPDLGRRFLDYLLSRRGQEVARKSAFFFSEDADLPEGVDGPETLAELGIVQPIHIGPALLAVQDEAQRRRFIDDWSRSLAHKPVVAGPR